MVKALSSLYPGPGACTAGPLACFLRICEVTVGGGRTETSSRQKGRRKTPSERKLALGSAQDVSRAGRGQGRQAFTWRERISVSVCLT